MFRIKKLDIFIAKQFGLLFVATFFICQFVLMMQFLWRYIDDLIGKGLTMDVLAQFFWYMALMLVPQAFPLAILLSSLIAYGNLGESSELTAIKAAGISLLQSMRSLILIVLLVAGVSIYFQEKIGPDANKNLTQLLLSMKQKSPELEIPEGVFYDGIPNANIYVQKKDLQTGMLYGMMIFRQTGSYEDQAIILADSGMLQSTAEKKHLLLTMWSGEWFENMKQQDLRTWAEPPKCLIAARPSPTNRCCLISTATSTWPTPRPSQAVRRRRAPARFCTTSTPSDTATTPWATSSTKRAGATVSSSPA